jgi:hypothetical protein
VRARAGGASTGVGRHAEALSVGAGAGAGAGRHAEPIEAGSDTGLAQSIGSG